MMPSTLQLASVLIALFAGIGLGGWRTRDLLHRLAAAERAATCDPLTGLANRTGFERAFKREIRCARHGHQLGVFLLDLDGFKQINDQYGHAVGDRLLAEVGSQLARHHVYNNPVIAARLGGDEFAVIFRGPAGHISAAEQASLAHGLEAAIGDPIVAGAAHIRPSASVGVACSRADAADLGDLLARADAAMYTAKRSERGTFTMLDAPTVRRRVHHRPVVRMRDRAEWPAQRGA